MQRRLKWLDFKHILKPLKCIDVRSVSFLWSSRYFSIFQGHSRTRITKNIGMRETWENAKTKLNVEAVCRNILTWSTTTELNTFIAPRSLVYGYGPWGHRCPGTCMWNNLPNMTKDQPPKHDEVLYNRSLHESIHFQVCSEWFMITKNVELLQISRTSSFRALSFHSVIYHGSVRCWVRGHRSFGGIYIYLYIFRFPNSSTTSCGMCMTLTSHCLVGGNV